MRNLLYSGLQANAMCIENRLADARRVGGNQSGRLFCLISIPQTTQAALWKSISRWG
jgi:hypothetical protein